MKFRSTVPVAEVKALQEKLVAAGHEATITHDAEFTYLNTTEAGEKWIRLQLANKDATATTASKGNWFVKPDAPANELPADKMEQRKKTNAVILSVFLVLFAPVLYFIVSAPPADPYQGMTWKEVNAEKFRSSSDFAVRLGMMVDRELVKFPRTKQIEGYRVFTIEPDSVTVVYEYSAENAFGVRSDHSITVVGDVRTEQLARVVSVQ